MHQVAWYWTVNPPGGYGRPEVLICESCIVKPEHEGLRQRVGWEPLAA